MPEMPEVQGLVDFLAERATGRTITKVTVANIAALKTYDPPIDGLVGGRISEARRHGKFVDLATDAGIHLIFHLAKAGWLRWYETVPDTVIRPGKTPIALRVRLGDGAGFDLTEAGTKKSLAVYVARDPQDVPGIARLGPDPLAEEFTRDALAGLLAGRRTQIKGVLRDQSIVAGIGNAYSTRSCTPRVCRPTPWRRSCRRRGRQALRRDAHDADGCRRHRVRQAARRSEGRETPRHGGARPARRGLPGVRRRGTQRLLRGQLTGILPHLSDGRKAARRPAAVAAAEVAQRPSRPTWNENVVGALSRIKCKKRAPGSV
jgi:formamidopyrimidine-DNA glycosylase